MSKDGLVNVYVLKNDDYLEDTSEKGKSVHIIDDKFSDKRGVDIILCKTL